MTTDLHTQCERLRALAQKKPNAETRREAEAALTSKWEGVQVTAARTLAAWGDAPSLAAVRDLLVDLCSKPARWAAVGAVADALATHAESIGTEWFVDLYLDQCRKENRFALWAVIDALPYQETTRLLESRLTKSGPDAEAVESLLGRLRFRRMVYGP